MKTVLVALITALAVSLLSTAAIAQPKGPPEGDPPGQLKEFKQGPPIHLITGGGIVQNDNSAVETVPPPRLGNCRPGTAERRLPVRGPGSAGLSSSHRALLPGARSTEP